MPSSVYLFEKYNNNKVFIETGSYVGDGIKNALFAGYKQIHSVEITSKYYNLCKNLFKHLNNIYLYHGDTEVILPNILKSISEPATIWLDAHYSGGETGFGNKLTPLLRELQSIKESGEQHHTILIDDLREWRIDFPPIGFDANILKEKLLEINPNYEFYFENGQVVDDILVAEIPRPKSINITVFSKDRAMQLDLFLRSFYTFVRYADSYIINVIYTHSADSFKDGYDKLIQRTSHKSINYIKEKNFKEDMIGCVDSQNKFTVFFVDDNVFKNYFDFFDRQAEIFDSNDDILCRSLRLNKELNYCYTLDVPMRQPNYYGDNTFDWKGLNGDFGYPMSVDGHIFRTEDILPYVRNLDYNHPNIFEGRMASNPVHKPKMILYEQSIIMNTPLNRVQVESINLSGNVSAEYLNEQFLSDKRIKLETFRGFHNISCHQEVPIELE